MDYLEVLELGDTMSVAEFDKAVRPYLMQRAGDLRWEVRFRLAHIQRFTWLLKKEVRKEKRAKIEQMLIENDTDKKMPFGGHLRH